MTGVAIQPIFIFSTVRSGSTLTQRIIAAHDGVATVPEPWLLLPYAYALRRQGIDSEYLHPLMVDAIEDFCERLPRGTEDYFAEVREFVLRLYRKATDERASHFIDKSPAYCLIAEDIMRVFPEGKFIFLWRNPLSIASSIIETWEPWHPALHREYLFVGLPRLAAAYAANRSRAYSVRFEDLVGGDERVWRPLMDYLGIEFEPDALRRFAEVDIAGRMGDQTGVRQYSALSSEPQEKWKSTLANPLRRAWCRRYLRFLGNERLALMGYDGERIVGELDSQPMSTSCLIPDLGRLVANVAREPIRVQIRRRGIGGPNVFRELLNA